LIAMPTPSPDPEPETPARWLAGRGWAVAALVLVFAVHSIQAVRLFPTLASIIDPDSPVLMVDHAIHEYHGELGARFLRTTGTTWGYDPSFMAGYPETPVWDSSSNPSILFDLIGGGQGYRSYKLGVLACSILVLAAIAAGGWAAGLGTAEVAAGSLLAWLVFWVGFPAALWRSGLFAFITACGGVALLLGLCSRFERSPTRRNWLALATTGVVVFFLHVTAPILAIGGLAGFYLWAGRRHGWKWHGALVGAGALAVVANLFWLVPLWQFRELRVGQGFFMTADTARFLVNYFLEYSPEGRSSLVVLVLGLGGLIGWWVTDRRGSAAAFGGSIVALLALTGFGSFWGPTRLMEPLRFRIGFLFLLAVPAGSAVIALSGWLGRRFGGGTRGAVAALAVWVALVAAWGATERKLARISWELLTVKWPLVVGLTSEMRSMVDWLRAKTDLSARVMFEDQLRLLEVTSAESAHWTPLLPDLLGSDERMFIGGLYHMAFIKHHQTAAFGDFHLGGLAIDDCEPAQMVEFCRAYNVGWVVCWSPLSKFWFDRYPLAKRVATIPRWSTPGLPPSDNEHEWLAMLRRGGQETAIQYMLGAGREYSVYRIDRPHSYFLKGKGRITSVGPNRVELADLVPEGGAVVVSLHWIDSWKADPPLTLRPEPVAIDPVEFVRIELPGPVDRVVLTNVPGHRPP
jgi:hypothetical protein